MSTSKNKRKKYSAVLRRKRLKRKNKLYATKFWIPKYKGKNIVKGYAKWFGVDLLCAIIELKLLNVEINISYEQKIRQLMKNGKKNRPKKNLNQEQENYYDDDSDDQFFYIAGYTSNGVPFGIT